MHVLFSNNPKRNLNKNLRGVEYSPVKYLWSIFLYSTYSLHAKDKYLIISQFQYFSSVDYSCTFFLFWSPVPFLGYPERQFYDI